MRWSCCARLRPTSCADRRRCGRFWLLPPRIAQSSRLASQRHRHLAALSSPADETEPHRGGRRNLLRSGTSGSITPLSATSPDPSPSPTASMDTPAPTPHAAASATNRRATEASTSSRTDALLVVATPAEEMFRSPSQQSAASDADGYFTARPGSPSDAADLFALARTRSALRRERVSWSGRSYATCSSSIHPDPIDADLAAASATLTLDDEACYVDADPLSPTDKAALARRAGVDFLSHLPPELALCILFMLDSHVDLLAAAGVSKRWRAIAMDQAVWRSLFFSRPGGRFAKMHPWCCSTRRSSSGSRRMLDAPQRAKRQNAYAGYRNSAKPHRRPAPTSTDSPHSRAGERHCTFRRSRWRASASAPPKNPAGGAARRFRPAVWQHL